MELKDFVKETLADIIRGIREAQRIEGVGEYVSPSGTGGHKFPENRGVTSNARITSTVVEFDVAVSSEKVKTAKGEGGIHLHIVEAGVGGGTQSTATAASRVKFSVPLLLPQSPRKWHKEEQRPLKK